SPLWPPLAYCLISGAIHSATSAAQFRTRSATAIRLSTDSHRSNTGGFFSVCRMTLPCLDDQEHFLDLSVLNPVCLHVEDSPHAPSGPRLVDLSKIAVRPLEHRLDRLADAAASDYLVQQGGRLLCVGLRIRALG